MNYEAALSFSANTRTLPCKAFCNTSTAKRFKHFNLIFSFSSERGHSEIKLRDNWGLSGERRETADEKLLKLFESFTEFGFTCCGAVRHRGGVKKRLINSEKLVRSRIQMKKLNV